MLTMPRAWQQAIYYNSSVETSEHNVKNEKLYLSVKHQNFKIGAMESELIDIRKELKATKREKNTDIELKAKKVEVEKFKDRK